MSNWEPLKLSEQENRIIGNISDSLLKGCIHDNPSNVVISPVSIYLMLSMLTKATENRSKQQLCDYIGSSADNIWHISKELQKHINSNEKVVSMAECMYVSPKFRDLITGHFKKLLYDDLSAEIIDSSFTVDSINDWVCRKTKGMIPQMLEGKKIPGDIILLNAISFKEKWNKIYEDWDIYEDVFQPISGEEQNVTMLQSKEKLYISDEIATGFIKPYKGYKYGFMALLPRNTNDPREMIDKMPIGKMQQLYHSAHSVEVDVTMPKFKFDFDVSIKDVLKLYGVNDMFDREIADLGGMLPVQKSYISNILHKAHIAVDRSGTKAAAATAGVAKAGCLPDMNIYEVILNRPFVFSIVDTITGIPLFQGIVNSIGPDEKGG